VDNPGVGAEDQVAVGQAALAAGRWADARTAFEAALAVRETPEALDGLAHALHWLGEYRAGIEARERAFAGFRARGETRHPAVLAAYWLAFEYAAVYGNFAAASGWVARGRRLAEDAGECAERGWVELACALVTDDHVVKERHVATALALARRFGDADLEFDALAYAGICRVAAGCVEDGMRMLDEAVAAATAGEVRSVGAAGEIYCKMLLACEMAMDVRRAEQWISVAESFARRTSFVGVSGICRMHYGGILTAAGRWAKAEQELTASLRVYDAGYRGLRSGALVRPAELRIRQGRAEDAAQLLAGQEHDSFAVRPLARLHLVQGDVEMAVTVLRRALDGRDAAGPDVPVLGLLAEAEVAAGRPDEARAVAARIRQVADREPMPLARAVAAYACGLAAHGDPRALGQFEAALSGFAAAGMPIEEARARLEIARLVAASKPDVAVAEARTALAVFDGAGAVPDADAAAALLRSLGAKGRSGPRQRADLSKREQEVLRLVGAGLSNPEIAERLFISRKTVSHHVSAVLSKLGLRNRTEAAAYALRTTSREH
jgi:DNA-binding CsgD family transcriptional regulator